MSDRINKLTIEVDGKISRLEHSVEQLKDMVLSFFSLVKFNNNDDGYEDFKVKFPESAKKLGM